MRQTIFGLAAAAVLMMTAGAAPAMACGGGLFQSSCSPCGYVDPCAAPVYVAPVYSGCNTGCGGWGHAALSDAGSWAPESAYEAEAPRLRLWGSPGPPLRRTLRLRRALRHALRRRAFRPLLIQDRFETIGGRSQHAWFCVCDGRAEANACTRAVNLMA